VYDDWAAAGAAVAIMATASEALTSSRVATRMRPVLFPHDFGVAFMSPCS
jgi:hypothetical protein